MTAAGVIKLDDLIKCTCSAFKKRFLENPAVCCFAPGRVNLIGEHTDYNDGFVLPVALPLVTVMVGKKNDTDVCQIVTSCPYVDEPKEVQLLIDNTREKLELKPGKPEWANYIKGVIFNFKGKLCGFNAIINTSVPIGGGLSSSAALEVATYYFLESMLNNSPTSSLIDIALSCQKAEHEFLGMPCGIMDQFISVMGRKDHALLLDCRSLEYELIRIADPKVTILITNTNVRHKLAESQYANRKRQCEEAAETLGVASLRDTTLQRLEEYRALMGEEVYSRALHVVTEIQRTLKAAEALKQGDYAKFGKLMIESHNSLRDNYGVSCFELDIVVNTALEVDGVYGSRMTGGGFGGCTVTLLNTNVIISAMNHIKEKYENATFYVCRPGEGAQIKQLKNEI